MATIIVKAQDFYNYVEDLKKDSTIEALEVSIYEIENFETGELEKKLSIDIVIDGGTGLIGNDDDLTEMTDEEIENIGIQYENPERNRILDQLLSIYEKNFTKKAAEIEKKCETCQSYAICSLQNKTELCKNWILSYEIYEEQFNTDLTKAEKQ